MAGIRWYPDPHTSKLKQNSANLIFTQKNTPLRSMNLFSSLQFEEFTSHLWRSPRAGRPRDTMHATGITSAIWGVTGSSCHHLYKHRVIHFQTSAVISHRAALLHTCVCDSCSYSALTPTKLWFLQWLVFQLPFTEGANKHTLGSTTQP